MKIFFSVDSANRIFPCCDWSEEITPSQDWLVGNLSGDAYEGHGIPKWKYIGGSIVARTQQEIEADIADLPIPEPTEMEQMQADIDYLTMENEYLDGVTEQQQADIDYCLMLLDEE